jgi:hypothetical protein
MGDVVRSATYPSISTHHIKALRAGDGKLTRARRQWIISFMSVEEAGGASWTTYD